MGEQYKLLIAEDDLAYRALLQDYLNKKGFQVYTTDSCYEAEKLVLSAKLDCVILDVDLPDGNGFALCERVRKATGVPIVFLSGHYKLTDDVVKGLTIGGDDYLCKPCSMAELEARVRLRILRRQENRPPVVYQFGQLVIDTGKRTVYYGKQTVDFTRIEFDLLEFLASQPERIFSYEQLYDAVWREPVNLGRHAVQARIAEVRQKLEQLCPERQYIITLRNKGYFFKP